MTGLYKPLALEEREQVARDCLNGQNNGRERIAKEILAGDLFEEDGAPKSYWHCLATSPPPPPVGRRGQWKAGGERPSGWWWQDWGPVTVRR